MNITHVKEITCEGDRLEFIFQRQHELMGKYLPIEKRSGLLQTEDCPVNLDSRKGQARIKDFAWRVMEEVGEALDSLVVDEDIVHYKEELVDGLHFLVELTILSGMSTDDIVPEENRLMYGDKLVTLVFFDYDKVNSRVERIGYHAELIRLLGMACNCLKNKPWKQTMMVTDKARYKSYIKEFWNVYIKLLSEYMDSEEIFQTYFKKSEVNKFRQRSNY